MLYSIHSNPDDTQSTGGVLGYIGDTVAIRCVATDNTSMTVLFSDDSLFSSGSVNTIGNTITSSDGTSMTLLESTMQTSGTNVDGRTAYPFLYFTRIKQTSFLSTESSSTKDSDAYPLAFFIGGTFVTSDTYGKDVVMVEVAAPDNTYRFAIDVKNINTTNGINGYTKSGSDITDVVSNAEIYGDAEGCINYIMDEFSTGVHSKIDYSINLYYMTYDEYNTLMGGGIIKFEVTFDVSYPTNRVYNHQEQTPAIVISDQNGNTIPEEYYDLEYKGNFNAGTSTIIVHPPKYVYNDSGDLIPITQYLYYSYDNSDEPVLKDPTESGAIICTREFEITPAQAVIKVDNFVKMQGDDDPIFTYTVEGLYEGDSLGIITFNREDGEDPGEYIIDATVSNMNLNYTYTVEPGILTIVSRVYEL